MLEFIGIISTVIAVAGAWLINRRIRFCFILWIVSNTLSAGIHLYTGPWALVARDVIFLALAIEGYKTWGKKDLATERQWIGKKDKNGKKICVGHELDGGFNSICGGVVFQDEDGEFCEYNYHAEALPLADTSGREITGYVPEESEV